MTTRGLPGFLRRSLRRDDFYTTSEDEDDDNDYGYDDGDNSIEDGTNSHSESIEESNDNETREKINANENISTKIMGEKSLLDPSPLAETSAREDMISGLANIIQTHTTGSPDSYTKDDNDDQVSMSSLGDSELGKDDNRSASRLPSAATNSANDSTSNNHNRSSKRFSINKTYRETQFEKVLGTNDGNDNHVVKMSELRKISWNGIPPQHRGMCWKILLGYLPTNAMRRRQTLERKRSEYKDAIQQHYYIDDNSRTIQEQETLRQVLVDVPRTAPDIPLFRNEKIKRALSRLLYIWAMRHPASSYVQGINDLATPLFAVFLADDYEGEDVLDGSVMVVLEEERLDEVCIIRLV